MTGVSAVTSTGLCSTLAAMGWVLMFIPAMALSAEVATHWPAIGSIAANYGDHWQHDVEFKMTVLIADGNGQVMVRCV